MSKTGEQIKAVETRSIYLKSLEFLGWLGLGVFLDRRGRDSAIERSLNLTDPVKDNEAEHKEFLDLKKKFLKVPMDINDLSYDPRSPLLKAFISDLDKYFNTLQGNRTDGFKDIFKIGSKIFSERIESLTKIVKVCTEFQKNVELRPIELLKSYVEELPYIRYGLRYHSNLKELIYLRLRSFIEGKIINDDTKTRHEFYEYINGLDTKKLGIYYSNDKWPDDIVFDKQDKAIKTLLDGFIKAEKLNMAAAPQLISPPASASPTLVATSVFQYASSVDVFEKTKADLPQFVSLATAVRLQNELTTLPIFAETTSLERGDSAVVKVQTPSTVEQAPSVNVIVEAALPSPASTVSAVKSQSDLPNLLTSAVATSLEPSGSAVVQAETQSAVEQIPLANTPVAPKADLPQPASGGWYFFRWPYSTTPSVSNTNAELANSASAAAVPAPSSSNTSTGFSDCDDEDVEDGEMVEVTMKKNETDGKSFKK